MRLFSQELTAAEKAKALLLKRVFDARDMFLKQIYNGQLHCHCPLSWTKCHKNHRFVQNYAFWFSPSFHDAHFKRNVNNTTSNQIAGEKAYIFSVMWHDIRAIFILCALAFIVHVSHCSIAVSLSKKLDLLGWSSLLSTSGTFQSASIHILFYNGTINPNAISTIKAAGNSSINDLSVYMHPCIETSVYSVQYGLYCGNAKEQFNLILDTVISNNIDFKRYLSLDTFNSQNNSPSTHPTALPTQSPHSTVNLLQRLFVCFEDEVPNRYMSNNHGDNVQFMLDLQNEAVSHGIQLGIYTTKNDWLNSMTETVDKATIYYTSGNDTNSNVTVNPFNHLPLWVPRFDSINSMDFYAPFGDWSRVFMKQISGSTTALHRIGSDRVGMNYVDDTAASLYYNNQILEYIVT